MKKMKRIAALLCALLMTATVVLSASAADDKEARAKATAEANAKKTELNQQITNKKKELNDAKAALNDAKKKTAGAKEKKDAAENQIKLLGEEIDLIQQKIDLTMDTLAAVEAAEQEQYDLFCGQVRQEEERGVTSYWSVLFRSTSFADLLSRIDFINEIMAYNQQIIAGLQDIRTELDATRQELEEEQKELEQAQSDQEKLAEEYRAVYQEYLSTQAGAQAAYDQVASEEAALESAMKEVEKLIQQLGIGSGNSGGYIWPVNVATKYITSKFGPRRAPTSGASTVHNGIDIGVSYVDVVASKAGTVVLAGWNGGFGNCVIISHGVGFSTTYGHLSKINVKVGQVVAQGEKIAVSGNTGVSTGPHLDFRIMENGVYVNPLNYLSGYVMLD